MSHCHILYVFLAWFEILAAMQLEMEASWDVRSSARWFPKLRMNLVFSFQGSNSLRILISHWRGREHVSSKDRVSLSGQHSDTSKTQSSYFLFFFIFRKECFCIVLLTFREKTCNTRISRLNNICLSNPYLPICTSVHPSIYEYLWSWGFLLLESIPIRHQILAEHCLHTYIHT
jgi:hypothetical protein